ncbi:MAG: aminoacyl-tRNA deacylase [Vicinamibacterales bacterium]
MAVTELVQEFLRQSNVAYSVFPHVPAYTAQEEAAVTHISGRDWAKPVVFFADGEPIMAVVPADLVIDLEQLLLLTGAERIRLATEEELAELYPDCEPGAMPPLGPLYNQPVFVDIALAAQPQVVFNGGTHGDAVCMRYDDFAALARPVVGSFAMRPAF